MTLSCSSRFFSTPVSISGNRLGAPIDAKLLNSMKILASILCLVPFFAAGGETLQPVVEVEETVYEYVPAKTGTTSLGCYGATCIARHGEDVFVSGLETIPGVPPMNNCRWTLFKRTAAGWQLQQADARPKGRR